MIITFARRDGRLHRIELYASAPIPQETLWIDLRSPTEEECRQVEAIIGIKLPARETMREIEASSRLYVDGDIRVMTIAAITTVNVDLPKLGDISFLVAKDHLVTVRDVDFRALEIGCDRLKRPLPDGGSPESVMLTLLEAVVDRAADLLEGAATQLDTLSSDILSIGAAVGTSKRAQRARRRATPEQLRELLRHLGRVGDLNSKAQESLQSISRLCLFYSQDDPQSGETIGKGAAKDRRARLRVIARDVKSLLDYSALITEKVVFLLEATLGLISIGQNEVVKVLTVASVLLMPPTLIASTYGMNFQIMPELTWDLGYLWALTLMVISVGFTYYLLRRNNYL